MTLFSAAEVADLQATFLTDRCTLESPVPSGSSSWTVVATNVPCQVRDRPGVVATPAGGLVSFYQTRVAFPPGQALAVDWRITLAGPPVRRLKIDSVVAGTDAPLQQVVASGTR